MSGLDIHFWFTGLLFIVAIAKIILHIEIKPVVEEYISNCRCEKEWNVYDFIII